MFTTWMACQARKFEEMYKRANVDANKVNSIVAIIDICAIYMIINSVSSVHEDS